MKKTEIAFYSIKKFGYSLLNIGGTGDSVEVFRLFFHVAFHVGTVKLGKTQI